MTDKEMIEYLKNTLETILKHMPDTEEETRTVDVRSLSVMAWSAYMAGVTARGALATVARIETLQERGEKEAFKPGDTVYLDADGYRGRSFIVSDRIHKWEECYWLIDPAYDPTIADIQAPVKLMRKVQS